MGGTGLNEDSDSSPSTRNKINNKKEREEMKYISNSNTEIFAEMLLSGKTRAEIKKEDLKRANTSKVYLYDGKVEEFATKWGAKFVRGVK